MSLRTYISAEGVTVQLSGCATPRCVGPEGHVAPCLGEKMQELPTYSIVAIAIIGGRRFEADYPWSHANRSYRTFFPADISGSTFNLPAIEYEQWADREVTA